jgi:hypothetical protein
MMQMLNVESQMSSRNKKQKIVMVWCSWTCKQRELENKMFKRKYETNWIERHKKKKRKLENQRQKLPKKKTHLIFKNLFPLVDYLTSIQRQLLSQI